MVAELGDVEVGAEAAAQGADQVDELETDRILNELMGKDASARFRFIMERAGEVDELDV